AGAGAHDGAEAGHLGDDADADGTVGHGCLLFSCCAGAGQPVAIPKERRMSAAACEGGPSSPVWNWTLIAACQSWPSWPSERSSQNAANSAGLSGLGSTNWASTRAGANASGAKAGSSLPPLPAAA